MSGVLVNGGLSSRGLRLPLTQGWLVASGQGRTSSAPAAVAAPVVDNPLGQNCVCWDRKGRRGVPGVRFSWHADMSADMPTSSDNPVGQE